MTDEKQVRRIEAAMMQCQAVVMPIDMILDLCQDWRRLQRVLDQQTEPDPKLPGENKDG